MKTIFIAEPGSRLYCRRGGVYIATRDGRKIAITPDVDQIIIASSRVGISAKAIRYLAREGIDVVILDVNGYPIARLYMPYINKTVATRVGQYEKILSGLGIEIAKELIYSKIMNQAQLLKYLAKSSREEWLRDLGYEVEAIATDLYSAKDLDRDRIMGFEAHASRKYWQAIASLIPENLGFRGRDPDSLDPFNMALNYGYGILYSVCEKALVLAGLDPYLGVLHVAKSGRPSLTLDFVEMFRPIAIDKPLVIESKRLKIDVVGNRLDYESRKRIAEIVLSNLSAKYRCSKIDRSMSLEEHIRREAWDLAKFFREGSVYKGFRVYL